MSGRTGQAVMRHAMPATLALSTVWAVLAWYRPTTTWHLAPALAVAAGPVLLRVRRGRVPWVVAVGLAAAAAAAALVTATILEAAGLLRGPALVGGSAIGEAVIVTFVAAMWAAWTAGRAGQAIIIRMITDSPPDPG